MMTLELGSRDAVGAFSPRIKLFLNAESLGGVESLASHSATTTHAALTEERRRSASPRGWCASPSASKTRKT
jgi:cystathionine beta-lyase/cystathionine gamma-synthase